MENLEIMGRIASSHNLVHTSEQHGVVVRRIIDFHRRKRRMNLGICLRLFHDIQVWGGRFRDLKKNSFSTDTLRSVL
jgi:hypothetical protein